MTMTVEDIFARHGIVQTDSLEHSGVKGMQWGKRKQKASTKTVPHTRHQIKKMTDTQLKKKIARLKLEKEYVQLTAPQVSAGKKMVKDILIDIGKQQAKNYINKQLSMGIDNVTMPKAGTGRHRL